MRECVLAVCPRNGACATLDSAPLPLHLVLEFCVPSIGDQFYVCVHWKRVQWSVGSACLLRCCVRTDACEFIHPIALVAGGELSTTRTLSDTII